VKINRFVAASLFVSALFVGVIGSAPNLRQSSELSSVAPRARAVRAAPVSAPSSSLMKFAKVWTGKPVYQAGPNCFGTTLAAFGEAALPRFASDVEIRHFLSSCEPVVTPRSGDVGMLYEKVSDSGKDRLVETHSYIMTDANHAFYKNGVEAAGKFVINPITTLKRDFRIGYSEAQCDRLVSATMEESGVPCPTLVKYFRCKISDADSRASEFTSGQKLLWAKLVNFETKMSESALSKTGPGPSGLEMFKSESEQLASDFEQHLSSEPRTESSKFMKLAFLRLDSLIGYLVFNADRVRWPQSETQSVKESLIRAKKAISQALQ
jgi:hypothetical protein